MMEEPPKFLYPFFSFSKEIINLSMIFALYSETPAVLAFCTTSFSFLVFCSLLMRVNGYVLK